MISITTTQPVTIAATIVATTPTAATPGPATTTAMTTTAPGAATLTNIVPSSSNQKFNWAHHIIGNTYPYTYSTWLSDIQLASSNGIDGFVLNIG